MSGTLPLETTSSIDAAPFDVAPPGERYYRHPGDVVRLVLWASTTVLLVLFLELATETSGGLARDLGGAAASLPRPVRTLLLGLVQVGAVLVPVVVVATLVAVRRWRRLLFVLAAVAAGAALYAVLGVVIDLPGRLDDALTGASWLTTRTFPTVAYVAAATAAATVGKPWLSRSWRRASDLAVVVLAMVMALAGTAGVPELLLAVAAGAAAGAGLLVAFGAPNRRPAPAVVASALRDAGIDVAGLHLVRAEEGRAQLYRARSLDGGSAFVKVYALDSRDADALYRGYRTLALREPGHDGPTPSLGHRVEHEALLLLLARQGGVSCPSFEALASLPDGSMALAMEDVDGSRLDSLPPEAVDDDLLDAVWGAVAQLHLRGIAHGSLRSANILVAERRPVLIDLSFGEQAAAVRLRAIDRAELLVSLATLVGAERATASAARVIGSADLATAVPYLQPLALSASTRRAASKALLHDLRASVAAVTGQEAAPLERLVRVRPRTLLTIAVLTGAFYLLLPQLAHVGDSFTALRSANWGWLAVCVVMSVLTYVSSAISLGGGVRQRLPLVANVGTQLASSFVNRVTPANVGGMALNVRFMNKVGVEPAEAVTGMGLNVAAGGIVHIVLLVVFVAWAKQADTAGYKLPSSSKFLVVIAVALAVAGLLAATRRGRRLVRTHLVRAVKQSLTAVAALARSPLKLLELFGGSAGVTLAYVAALTAAVAAYGGDLTFAQVGAVYLGSSIIAAAAPTPGGLGAMEAALVAGLTSVGLEPGLAVAAVLSYRLATYWLPILPGWISFHVLERRAII